MSEPQREVPVRDIKDRQRDSSIESASDFGDNLVRFSVAALTGPLALLPRDLRTDARRTTRDFVYAVAKLHRGFANVVIDAIEDWSRDLNEGSAARAAARNEAVRKN